jgi:hypothetical protein
VPVRLRRVDGRFAVVRLPAHAEPPAWAVFTRGLFSVTRTSDELSLVVDEAAVPHRSAAPPEQAPPRVEPSDAGTDAAARAAPMRVEAGWAAIRVEGTLPFGLTGILAGLTKPLAAAGVGVFALSTYDTDYLLVKEDDFSAAVQALREAGHSFEGPS